MRGTVLFLALGTLFLALGTLVFLSLPASDVDEEGRTPEAMARLAFEAMQANDPARLEATIPSVETLRAMFRELLRPLSDDDRAKAEAKMERGGGVAGVFVKMRKRIRSAVRAARDAATKDFDLGAATFEGARLTEVRPMIYGTRFVNGTVTFTVRAGGIRYAFETFGAMRLNGDWNFGEGWHYVGPMTAPNVDVQRWIEHRARVAKAVGKARGVLRPMIKRLVAPVETGTAPAWNKARDTLLETLETLPTASAIERVRSAGRDLLANRQLNPDDRHKLERALQRLGSLSMDVEAALDAFSRPRWDREKPMRRVRERLNGELHERIRGGDERAALVALLLRLPAAGEPTIARFDAAPVGEERLWIAHDLVQVAPKAARTRLVAWATSAARPVQERLDVYTLVFRLLEREAEARIAIAIGADAVLYLVRQQLRRGDMDAARYIPAAPADRRSALWTRVFGTTPSGIEPEAAWPLIASDDADLVVRSAEHLALLQAAATTVQLKDAPLAEAAEALAAVTGLPFEAIGEGRVTFRHAGTGSALPLRQALERAGLTLRVTATTCFIGTTQEVASRIERDRRVPFFAAKVTDSPLVLRTRRVLRGETSVSFFLLGESIAECLCSIHFTRGTNLVVLRPLLRKAGDRASEALNGREVRPWGVHLRRLLDACDGGAAVTDEALIIAPVDAFPRLQLHTRPEGVAAPWQEPVRASANSRRGSSKRSVQEALWELPRALQDTISVSQEALDALASEEAPFLYLDPFIPDEEKLTNWGYLQLMLLDSGYCSYVDKGAVSIGPVETGQPESKPKK